MIPEMKAPKLLPLFTEWMRASSTDPQQSFQYSRQKIPLECQVYSTSPTFVVSDKFHLVTCEFSQSALVSFKKDFPLIQLKDLVGKFVVLQQYAPHSVLVNGTDLDLTLHIYEFTIYCPAGDPEEILGDPVELLAAPEITQLADLTRKWHLRQAIKNSKTLDDLPRLEDILTAPEPAECNSVIVPVSDNKGKKTVDMLGEKIVDYTRIEDHERKAIQKAAKLLEEEEKLKQKRRAERAAAHAQAKKAERPQEKPEKREHRLKGSDIARLLKKKAVMPLKSREEEKVPSSKIIESGVAKIIARVKRSEPQKKPPTKPPVTGRYSVRQTAKRSKKIEDKKRKHEKHDHREVSSKLPKRTMATRASTVTASSLKKFTSWKAYAGRSTKTNKDITGELRKTGAGAIQVSLRDSDQKAGKAFGAWISSAPIKKKRAAPENDGKKSKRQAQRLLLILIELIFSLLNNYKFKYEQRRHDESDNRFLAYCRQLGINNGKIIQTWDIRDSYCTVCMNSFETPCPHCKFPGDDCPPSFSAAFQQPEQLKGAVAIISICIAFTGGQSLRTSVHFVELNGVYSFKA
eukprot:TRINITY_DN1040_c0_g1_i1.p1 TRINITY_DN1040_c0_g1~~TRINITY_DN1040_c0_g1_i1.p1  ORF type:complete len:574 (-),score=43.86 TRINITY_DN1040_c0_g1_i1:5550-7271(-)